MTKENGDTDVNNPAEGLMPISRRALIAASKMQQDLREDEIIIVPAAGLPLRIGRAIYFRRPEMMAQVASNRFVNAAAE